MKVVIAGSRSFNDYETLKQVCDHMLQNQIDVEIVSGNASGADKLGERYAREKGYRLKQFPADWLNHGKSAGYKRNLLMAEYADGCIIFWNGVSAGSKIMKNICEKLGLKLRIHYF